jgi:50S ribosomal protein L16 3-hydroxylase
VDLHNEAAHQLLQQFRFVPDARMDDLMISFATDQGGVGPHFDNYDVFLLQAHGKRRWRIGRQKDFTLQEGVPLKILTNFEPEEEWVLEPGDMLYLPPKWAHDGIAEGECMTYSVGFRSPKQDEMARELFCACPMPRTRRPRTWSTRTPSSLPWPSRAKFLPTCTTLPGKR